MMIMIIMMMMRKRRKQSLVEIGERTVTEDKKQRCF